MMLGNLQRMFGCPFELLFEFRGFKSFFRHNVPPTPL
jgi:hypothetical protein